MAICELLENRAGKTSGGNPASPAFWVEKLFGGGGKTDAGIEVNEDSALTYAPFWACVNIIAGAVGMLPLILYRRVDKGKSRAVDNPLYGTLHTRPNPYMSAQVFRETLTAHVLTWGNGYAEIERDGAGRVKNLWPLLPNRVIPKLTEAKPRTLFYEVTLKGGGMVKLPYYNVLHIPGLGFDGLVGYSVIQYHRESIGLGMATKKFGASFFGRGAVPGGVFEHPGRLGEVASKNLRNSLEKEHSGLDKAHRIMIIEEGMKWHQTGIPAKDAQCIETQKFSIADMSRIFQVPPHMLGDLEKTTIGNIENLAINFVVYTLSRWLKKWEGEVDYKLIPDGDKSGLFVEHLIEGMLRGDSKTRASFYRELFSMGAITQNQILTRENMNTIGPDGDKHYVPMNLAAVEDGPVRDDDDRAGEASRQAAASSGPLVDAVSRMMRKEENDLKRASRKPDGLDEWSDGYYVNYEENFRSAIMPAVNSTAQSVWGVLAGWGKFELGEAETVGALTAEAVREYVAESRRLLDEDGVAGAASLCLASEAGRAKIFTESLTERIVTTLIERNKEKQNVEVAEK